MECSSCGRRQRVLVYLADSSFIYRMETKSATPRWNMLAEVMAWTGCEHQTNQISLTSTRLDENNIMGWGWVISLLAKRARYNGVVHLGCSCRSISITSYIPVNLIIELFRTCCHQFICSRRSTVARRAEAVRIQGTIDLSTRYRTTSSVLHYGDCWYRVWLYNFNIGLEILRDAESSNVLKSRSLCMDSWIETCVNGESACFYVLPNPLPILHHSWTGTHGGFTSSIRCGIGALLVIPYCVGRWYALVVVVSWLYGMVTGGKLHRGLLKVQINVFLRHELRSCVSRCMCSSLAHIMLFAVLLLDGLLMMSLLGASGHCSDVWAR